MEQSFPSRVASFLPMACLSFLLFNIQANPANAQETKSYFDLIVENEGEKRLSCTVSFAHWFAAKLGEIDGKSQAAFTFGVDLATGRIFSPNAAGDEMAVEQIWCGHAGNDWATRATLPLMRQAGHLPSPRHFSCISVMETTRCSSLPNPP